MSQNAKPVLDLSALPAEIRSRVEQAMQRLPPEQRMQLMQAGSPLLAKLLERAQSGAGQRTAAGGPPPVPRTSAPSGMAPPVHAPHHLNPRSAPRGHFNDTIRPGDGQGMRWLPLAVVVAVLVTLWFQF